MEYSETKLLKKKTKYANEDNFVSLAETCLQLGELYKEREEPQRALNEYKLAAKAYEKINRNMERGLAYRMVGEMYSLLGQFKEALQNVQAYMRAARKEANVKALQAAHVTIGRVYLHRAECYRKEGKSTDAKEDLNEAEKSFRTALEICNDLQGTVRKSDLLNMQAGVLLNLGITLDYQDKREPAQENMERAIRLAKEADLFELLYTCYNAMALCSSRWETLDGGGKHCGQTLRLLNQALDVASRLANRASKMCQTLILITKFFLKMDDFQSARQALKRAYRLKTPVSADVKWIERKLKVLVSMCRMEDELITLDATNYARRKELYERMGDGACKMHNYTKAIGYYQRMLQCAEALGEANRQLIPCYVSLYLTYTDNRQYEEAIDYLWKEYNIIENEPTEAYHTLMKIAKVYERQKKSFFEIQNVYLRAKEEGKKQNSIELQRDAVRRAIKLLRANCMDLMADKLEQDASDEGITDLKATEPDSEELPDLDPMAEVIDYDEVEEGDEEDPNTSKVGNEIDLNVDLSDDSDDTDQHPLKGADTSSSSAASASRTRKRGKKFVIRRNQKGETQLHQAAIAGKRDLAERLLELGHPVNERDYAGWLPLHEACIHGHSDMVCLLLDRGAHLNDKGGTSCEGITPLHDACRNGHLDVIEVLLDRGANATQRNDYGETALSMLDIWNNNLKESLSSDESNQYQRIRDRLTALFDAAAIPISSPPVTVHTTALTTTSRRRQSRRHSASADLETPFTPTAEVNACGSNRTTGTGSSGYASDMSATMRHRNTIFDADTDHCSTEGSIEGDDYSDVEMRDSSTEVSEYRNVMEAMRKNKLSDKRQPMSLSAQKRRQAHRIVEDDDVEDDWLIDDMKQSAKKSRVTRDLHRTSLGGRLEKNGSSSSLNIASCSPRTNVDKDGTASVSNYDPTLRLGGLVDSDDDEPFVEQSEDRDRENCPSRNEDDATAFHVLMNNSARSFRRVQRRRNSSELRSSSSTQHKSNVQSSLLDAGFQRVSSPTLEEKENLWPQHGSTSTTPVKNSGEISCQQEPLNGPVSESHAIQVIIDGEGTYSVNYKENELQITQTIGWLRNEVARQYMMRHGKRPTIKLQPAIGSVAYGNSFFDTDAVQILLENGTFSGATVFGEVHGYERIKLESFHDEYCEEHNIANDKELRKRIISMEDCKIITVEPDFAYNVPSTTIPPDHVLSMLFMVIYFQQDCINHLDLSMNSVTDVHMAQLAPYLQSSRHLRILRLRMNLLTRKSVEMLCFGCKKASDTADDTSNACLPLGGGMLTELDLSHNPLEDDALEALSRLCNSLPSLRILNLRSTDITTFSTTEQPCIDISRLESFDISENSLTDQSVRCLLQQLVEGRLKEAYFRSLAVDCADFTPKLWQTIDQHQLNALRLLNLSNCRLKDDDVESSLLPALGRNCAALTHLDLSYNVSLTSRSFLMVLKHCATASYRLAEVRFDHDVQLLVDLEAMDSTDRLLQLIEHSHTTRYPEKIHAILPVSEYTSERYEKLLVAVSSLWRAVWSSALACTTKHDNGLEITLSVDSVG